MIVYDIETGARDGYCGHWDGRSLTPREPAVRECPCCRDKQREIDLLRAIINGQKAMREIKP